MQVKITDEMNAAGCRADKEFHRCQADRIDGIFNAMQAATPNPTAWTGECLPPVGTVCEYRIDGKWQEINVVAHVSEYGNKLAVFQLADVDTWSSGFGTERFRPLRTPEQIAAEERREGIDAMCKLVQAHPAYSTHNVNIDCSAAMRLVVEALYDAGCRLPQGGAQ